MATGTGKGMVKRICEGHLTTGQVPLAALPGFREEPWWS